MTLTAPENDIEVIRRILCAGLCCSHSVANALDVERPQIRSFIQEMSQEHGYDPVEVRQLLAQAETRQAILDAISRPAERVVPWFEYRQRFLTPTRVTQGESFWRDHLQRLAAVEAAGVSAAIVVGILGVETSFGRNTGRYRVLDALATLAFDYPPRGAFFRDELRHFLLLVREEAVDPVRALGSYAGAMGAPQFISSSYRRFAVDGDNDGRRNLWQSWDDVIASVANYLREHGWRASEPICVPARVSLQDAARIDSTTLALNETVQSLRAKGVRFETDMPDTAPAMLIAQQEDGVPEYRVGFNNFYVITRYNRSPMYAMAVHDLGMAISGARLNAAP